MIIQKSITAIEKLIGQSIPRVEGDFATTDASHTDTDQPREHRSKDSSRRGRKGNREREPRHTSGRHHGAQPPSAAQRAPREVAEEPPADHSHLPAFLLRPIRARA